MIFLGAIAGIVEDSGQITGAHLAGTEIEVVNEPHSVGIGIGDQSVSLLIRQLLFIISEGRNTADVFAISISFSKDCAKRTSSSSVRFLGPFI